MKLQERENVAAPKARALVAPRAADRPNIAVRARVVSRPIPRKNTALAELCNRTVAFAAILGVTYFGSTLAGYVMLERARQSARHGAERAAYAQIEAKLARESIEALTNPGTLRAWADAHGFVPSQTTEVHGSGLVAQR